MKLNQIPSEHPKNYLKSSLIWTALVFVLTAFHHYYGALVYHSPWRMHVSFIGGIAFLAAALFLYLYQRNQKTIFIMVYFFISFVVFGLVIGIYEGLYNHLIKNILFFAGLNANAWQLLFPAPTYEIPDSFIFEITGIFQFVFAVIQIFFLYKAFNLTVWQKK